MNEEVEPFDDGKVVANGYVWKLYFEGDAPSNELVAKKLSTLGLVKAQMVAEGATARVTPTINKEDAK